MTVTRTNLLTYLSAEAALHKLATNAGFSEDDNEGGYGPALDATMFTVAGDAEATEVESNKLIAARVVAKYYALDTLQGVFAERVATSVEGAGSRSDQQAFTQIGVLLARQQEVCKGFGYSVGSAPKITSGRVLLDYLAPHASRSACGVG